MQEAGVLDAIIAAYLQHAEDETPLTEMIEAGMQGTSFHLAAQAKTALRRERDDLFRKALPIRPKNKNFRINYGKFMIDENRLDEARGIIAPLGQRIPEWLA